MLRKSAAVLAVGLLCLSGQASAQQATAKPTAKVATSAVQRVGPKSGQSNEAFGYGSPLFMFMIVGGVMTVVVVNNNNNKKTPTSP